MDIHETENQPVLPGDIQQVDIDCVNHIAAVVQANSAAKGFWDAPRNKGEMIALMHSELSEALEAIRTGNTPDSHVPQLSSLDVEMADVVIRVMDFCHGFGIDLGRAIARKHAFNRTRPAKHGKKF